ncbi:methyltransferase domain-containing protein [Aquibium microcysteis]|uniref:methyltransferase domain-containing protein n=1 Tax=Aquibium microcysteis TaxID=675281 RepID=UPI00165D16AC|nr:class I SAM-dependent methyltransferase [Aquibium microcysteis]
MKYFSEKNLHVADISAGNPSRSSTVPPVAVDSAITMLLANGPTYRVDSHGGQAALGFPFIFIAGARHNVTLEVQVGTAAGFRVEVHGRVTKMQKAVAKIGSDGSIHSISEEIRDLSVKVLAVGRLEISFCFVPFRTRLEYLYLFAFNDAENVSENCLLEVAPALFESWKAPLHLRSMEHVEANIEGEYVCAIQEVLIIENYIKIEFEIHKRGSELRAIGVRHGSMRIATSQWWNWLAGGRTSPTGGDDAYCWPAPQQPSAPIMAPALVDCFGPDFVHHGHAVTLLLNDLPDFQARPLMEIGRLGEVFLRAEFQDGSSYEIDVAAELAKGGPDDWNTVLSRSVASLLASAGDNPLFLEVGARGDASCAMRNWANASGLRYLGLDIVPSPNVDMVGDAHQLSRYLDEGSVDVVYSSEVLEHLVSPVAFIAESGRVLRPGGLFICRAPTTWPLHAEPWDFCRFSRHSWQGLLNAGTGFEIIGTYEFGRASVLPRRLGGASGIMMSCHPAPMLSAVIARRTDVAGSVANSPERILAEGHYDPA